VLQVVTTGLFDEDIPLTQPSRTQKAKAERVLRRFALWSLRERRMLTLSYGQRRLVLVARAFVGPARVLLLDDVFNGLDIRAKAKLKRALERPHGGHEWIISSHRPHELPRNVTHTAHIAAGRVTVTKGRAQAARVSRNASRAHAGVQPGERGDWLVRIRGADLFRDYRPVIRDLNWTIHAGEHWAIMGANGSGKSTLLSLIYGDLHPALGGTIERRGVPRGTRIERWKARVGWVSPELQADHYGAKSIEEIVISGRYASVGLNQPPTAADRRIARRWLQFFGIDALRERGPRQVSYGQMRKALIARAMVNAPRLLLLDEPLTGLDTDVRDEVFAALERVAAQGTQLVIAVHDEGDIPAFVTNVLEIGKGGKVLLRSES
jgi:molybdate transport system ATP-binding protein